MYMSVHVKVCIYSVCVFLLRELTSREVMMMMMKMNDGYDITPNDCLHLFVSATVPVCFSFLNVFLVFSVITQL